MNSKSGIITISYTIEDHDGMFSWYLSNGDESDEWFEDAESALNDLKSRY